MHDKKESSVTFQAAKQTLPAQRPETNRSPQQDVGDADDDRTYVRKDVGDLAHPALRSIGQVDLDEQRAISFEVEGKHLTLPVAQTLTVGRAVKRPFAKQPDVDVGPFESQQKSVSRQHIRLRRQGTLLHVADLGSRNGTWLNGHRLLKNVERLLRHGDELQLGNLRIRVKFHAYPR